jgi:hypothetical protein
MKVKWKNGHPAEIVLSSETPRELRAELDRLLQVLEATKAATRVIPWRLT